MLKKNLSYNDIPFFITPNAFTGDLNLISQTTAIRQSLKNIILTNNGERKFDYLFGGNIYNYLFDNFTPQAILEVQAKIVWNIRVYEPRVIVNNITITEDLENYSINITVDFGILDTGTNDTLTVIIARIR